MDGIWCQTNFDTMVSFDPYPKTIDKHTLERKRKGRFLPWSSDAWPLPSTV